jgi:hypothetical protein
VITLENTAGNSADGLSYDQAPVAIGIEGALGQTQYNLAFDCYRAAKAFLHILIPHRTEMPAVQKFTTEQSVTFSGATEGYGASQWS